MKKLKTFFISALSILTALSLTLGVFAYAGDIPEDVITASSKIANQIETEGIVLLKNEGSVLPLKNTKVNIFGVGSVDPYIGGTGSGAVTTLDYVDFYEGLESAGVKFNDELKNAYEKWYAPKRIPVTSSTIANNAIQFVMQKHIREEMPLGEIPVDVLKNAEKYSDTAMFVIARAGSEHEDYNKENISLSAVEKEVFEYVASNYKNVIVVFNTSNIMEMAFIESYPSVKAAVLIGIPGEFGFDAVGKVLKGKANPSGRLADTVALSVDDHPSTQNFGSYKYNGMSPDSYFVEYEEGIYVGYRYFETFAPEKVLYPFGYGLSYTSFTQKPVSYSEDGNKITVSVKVTNKGKTAGKDVVQVYYCPPYTAGGIEKSAINLAGFEKTKELSPGKSQTVEISFDIRSMSSYDMSRQAWVLEKGDYVIKVGSDVRNFTGEFIYSNPSDVVYTKDDVTSSPIKNLFGFAPGNATYLSRSNPSATYPSSPTDFSAFDGADKIDQRPAPVEGKAPKTGVVNDPVIKLEDVYNDESLWDAFLDQLTVEEMINLTTDGCYHTVAIDRLGVPATVDNDGPAQVKGVGGVAYTVSGVCYPAESVLGCTWNRDLAKAFGDRVGTEAEAIGTDVWYAPGFNIHRNPLQGRNFEYFSEDPLLSGILGAQVVNGAQSHGVAVTAKHFVVNEQETHRADNGLFIWCTEQALREIYLKPFEITVKTAHPWGMMSSYSRIGAQWCGACPSLLIDLLRKEWGFDGFVVTDYYSNFAGTGYMDPALAVYSGNDLILSGLSVLTTLPGMGAMKKAYNADPVGFGQALRTASKNILMMKMRTNAFKQMIEPANSDENNPTETNPSNQADSGANSNSGSQGTPSNSNGMNNSIDGAGNPSSGHAVRVTLTAAAVTLCGCTLLGVFLIIIRKKVKQ